MPVLSARLKFFIIKLKILERTSKRTIKGHFLVQRSRLDYIHRIKTNDFALKEVKWVEKHAYSWEKDIFVHKNLASFWTSRRKNII